MNSAFSPLPRIFLLCCLVKRQTPHFCRACKAPVGSAGWDSVSRSLERGSNPTALAGDHPELMGTSLERQLGVFSILLCQQGAPKPLGGTPKSRLKHLKGWPSIRWGVPSPSRNSPAALSRGMVALVRIPAEENVLQPINAGSGPRGCSRGTSQPSETSQGLFQGSHTRNNPGH